MITHDELKRLEAAGYEPLNGFMLFDKIPEVNSDTIIHDIQKRWGDEFTRWAEVINSMVSGINAHRLFDAPTLLSALVDLYEKLNEGEV